MTLQLQTLPCFREGCIEPQHNWAGNEQDGMCVTDGINADDLTWSVRGFYDTATRRWDAFADLSGGDDFEGAEGVTTLRKILAAQIWAQEICDALNEGKNA